MWNYTWNLTQQREMCTRRGHHAMLSNPSAQTQSKTVGIFARKKKLFSWGAGRFLLKLQNEIFEEKTWRLATRWSNIFQEKVSLFQFSRVLFLIYRWWSSPTANKTSMYIGMSPNLRMIYPKAKNTKLSDRLFWNFCPIALWISDMETYYFIHLHN